VSASPDRTPASNPPKRSNAPRQTGAAIPQQNKDAADKNGATPHPPAVFGSGNFFSFIFLQTRPPDCASAGGLRESVN